VLMSAFSRISGSTIFSSSYMFGGQVVVLMVANGNGCRN